MTKFKKAGPPAMIALFLAGLIGYILGCTREPRDRAAQVSAQESTTPKDGGQENADQSPATDRYSPVKARARDFYTPNSEDLGPDEMRLIACGTGMPTARPKQAACCWLLELGNGDKFLFDVGTGSNERIAAMQIPYNYHD